MNFGNSKYPGHCDKVVSPVCCTDAYKFSQDITFIVKYVLWVVPGIVI